MAMYLDIPGIAGESLSPNPNWTAKIEIASMQYSLSQDSSAQHGGGKIASAVSFQPMVIEKSMDKSTPMLFGKMAGGEPIATVTIRVSRPGGSATGPQGGLFEAETYTMQNVIVTDYHTTGENGPSSLPIEHWTLAFTAITERFQTVDATGNLQPVQQAGYNISGGAAFGV